MAFPSAQTETRTSRGADATLKATKVNEQKFDYKKWNAGLQEYVFGRAQPQAVELEEAILGALLTDYLAIQKVGHILKPECFYLEAHQVIYRSITEMIDAQMAVDLLTVTHWMKTRNLLDKINGGMYLVELGNRVASSANIEHHARIVAQQWIARDAIRLFSNGIKSIYEGTEDVFEVRNWMSDQLRVMPFSSYLRVRDANEVLMTAAAQPDLLQLAGSLLSQQDISLLFAQPGVGKSILAVQIAEAVSRGKQVFPEGILNNQSGPMRTGFFDFELLDKEFYKRYSDKEDYQNQFVFGDNFFRIDINPNFTDFPEGGDIEQHILREIENAVITYKLEFIVIDNISALISQSASDPNVALRVMATLKKLRIKYNLTLLVLAHTTKQYNKTKSLEMEDMGGAAALQNFAPTIFAIGRNANDDGELYIKQVKGRNGLTFGKDNVIRAEITKRDGNFLCFEYRGQGRESDMLASFLEADTQDHLIQAAIDHINRTGDGLRTTAKAIGWAQSHNTLRTRIAEYRQRNNGGGSQREFEQLANYRLEDNPPGVN